MFAETLSEFQDFLCSRNLVPENKVSYYADWASKSLAFSNSNDGLNQELQIKRFLSRLKTDKKSLSGRLNKLRKRYVYISDIFLKENLQPFIPTAAKMVIRVI